MAKTHRMFIIIGPFPQKSPIISGSFAENDLQLAASYGSLSPCNSPSPLPLPACAMFLEFDERRVTG